MKDVKYSLCTTTCCGAEAMKQGDG